MTDREQILLRAASDFVKQKIAGISPGAQSVQLGIPSPQVHNHVDTPSVQVYNKVETPEVLIHNEVQASDVTVDVDTSSVVDAINRLTAAVEEAVETLADKMDELLEAFQKQPAIEVHPVVNVPAARVTLDLPQREKRKLRIKHDDGTVSVITEE